MGLDIVELIIEAENTFGIQVPNEDAAHIRTAGELHAFVVRARGLRLDSPEAIALWDEVRALIVRQLGVDITDVTPSAAFVEDLKAD